MGTRKFRLNVTLLTASGQTIVRPVTLTDQYASNAKFRASKVAPKPGQTVVAVAVVA